MYKLHETCRACGYGRQILPSGIKAQSRNENLVPVFDLGIQPLANDFRNDEEERAGFAPLKVLYCPNCTLAQLSVVVRPDILYSTYSYVTSSSKMMHEHFGLLNAEINLLGGKGKVLEIGSNDGSLLDYLKTNGRKSVFGIDPAENLVVRANQRGIPTMCEFFGAKAARKWKHECGTADIILARHVFCHVDNWRDFMDGLEIVSTKDTLIGIEVPHLESTLAGVEFDTIYHEHLSYMTLGAMNTLLRRTNFHIHSVQSFQIHHGAIVIWLRHNDSAFERAPELDKQIASEAVVLYDWERFASKANENIVKLKSTVRELRATGKTVCGFGASAKSTVWLNACGFRRKDILFVTDTTPEKMYKTIPGTDIPVSDQGALLRDLPDYAVCFAWNYFPEILEQQKMYIEKGGRFIVPVPQVTIVPFNGKTNPR